MNWKTKKLQVITPITDGSYNKSEGEGHQLPGWAIF